MKKNFKKDIAKYVAFILLASAMTGAPAAPAAAHTGSCTVTGNTWHSGTGSITVYGSGNVQCNSLHDQLYIKVTLQQLIFGDWNNNLSSAEKTDSNKSFIYKQTSAGVGLPLTLCSFRVKIYYTVSKSGTPTHTDTVYRGQQRHPCVGPTS